MSGAVSGQFGRTAPDDGQLASRRRSLLASQDASTELPRPALAPDCQVLGEGGRLAAAGALAGMLGALQLSRLLARLTLGNRSPSLWVWLAAPLAAAGGIWWGVPARRGADVEP